MTTLLFLIAIAMLVLGPKKALELSRTAGIWWRKIENIKNEAIVQLNNELTESLPEHKGPTEPANHPGPAL